MSGPKTRPFDEPLEMDNDQPPVKIEATERSSVSSTVNNSRTTNDALPYIWFNGVLGALAVGLAIGAVFIAYIKTDTVETKVDLIRDRATVSENHWRNIETEQGIMKNQLEQLEKHHGEQR